MNFRSTLVSGALLLAAPVFSQHRMAASPDPQWGKNHELVWVSMDDSKAKLAQVLGKPRMSAEFGVDFQTRQYQIADGDHDDFSHQLVFRKSTGKLVSITRNYEPQVNVSAFFPKKESATYKMEGATPYNVLVRRMADGSLLLAPGLTKPDEPAGQLMLMRESELRHFYPWLADLLAKK